MPLLLACVACSTLDPDKGPALYAYTLRVGGQLIADFDTDLRLDSDIFGRGTSIDLEDDVGLDDSVEVGRVDLELRFDRRHGVELSYYDIDRGANHVLLDDIQFGHEVFPSGLMVRTTFNTQIFKGSYRNTFLVGEDWELGASIGLHGIRFQAGISALGPFGVSQEFKAPLPLPVVGLDFTWEIVPRLRLIGSTDVFYVTLENFGSADQIRGGLLDSVLAIEHDTLDHVGLGLGINYFALNASYGSDLLRLSAEYDYLGVLAYVRMFF